MEKNIHNYNSLEFNQIVENLKSHLKQQEEFKDYNFEGSNLQILIDLLAYNSHYNNAYLNFALNELFLASASRRHNILSIANQLGYIPHSARASVATVDIILKDFQEVPESIVLDDKITFATMVEDVAYNFKIKNKGNFNNGRRVQLDGVTNIDRCESIESNEQGNAYIFSNVEIIEGINVVNYFDVQHDSQDKFTLMNKMIDMSTMRITVFPNADIMKQAIEDPDYINTNIQHPVYSLHNTAQTFSYYFRESDNNTFNIIFKNGYLKKGNIIKMEYVVCNGPKANGAINFLMNNYSHLFKKAENIPKSITVKAKIQSNSGHDRENIETIRENAPIFFAAQNRAVTLDDYKALLINQFGYIDSLTVWGGEDEVEAQPGKIFIAIKPNDGKYLDNNQRDEIHTFIKGKSFSSSIVEIMNVNFLNVIMDAKVVYSREKLNTIFTEAGLKTQIKNSIKNYSNINLKKFNDVLQLSKLTSYLFNEYSFLESVDFDMKIQYEFDTRVKNINTVHEIDLFNAIDQIPLGGSIKSSPFKIYNSGTASNYYIVDDGIGNVLLKSDVDLYEKKIGTIDYKRGYIEFSDILVIDDMITMNIKPKNRNLINSKNNLLTVNENNIFIDVKSDRNKNIYNI